MGHVWGHPSESPGKSEDPASSSPAPQRAAVSSEKPNRRESIEVHMYRGWGSVGSGVETGQGVLQRGNTDSSWEQQGCVLSTW